MGIGHLIDSTVHQETASGNADNRMQSNDTNEKREIGLLFKQCHGDSWALRAKQKKKNQQVGNVFNGSGTHAFNPDKERFHQQVCDDNLVIPLNL